MEKAENLAEFIKRVAEELSMADYVYYDRNSLQYGTMMDNWLWEYGEYLDLSDEEFNAVPEDELGGWQREVAEDLRKVVDLPSRIDKPLSAIAFCWMEKFAWNNADNCKFYDDAVKALRNRHPFQGFRAAVDRNGLTKEWYKFQDAQMLDYVCSFIL